MIHDLANYAGVSPQRDLLLIQRLGKLLKKKSFLHINSTKAGGGVAEILHRMIPLLKSIGINARWDVIEGDDQFFDMTKKVHNALQGNNETISSVKSTLKQKILKSKTEKLKELEKTIQVKLTEGDEESAEKLSSM